MPDSKRKVITDVRGLPVPAEVFLASLPDLKKQAETRLFLIDAIEELSKIVLDMGYGVTDAFPKERDPKDPDSKFGYIDDADFMDVFAKGVEKHLAPKLPGKTLTKNQLRNILNGIFHGGTFDELVRLARLDEE